MHKMTGPGDDSLTNFENSLNDALEEDIAGPGDEDEEDQDEDEPEDDE